jgi:hypothetical protein
MKKGTGIIWALLLATGAALAFIALASVRIDGQGLVFDEVPTAPASFLLLGKQPYEPHTVLIWRSLPLLCVAYIGALKSLLFGLMMKFLGLEFSVASWRMFGIAMTTVGLWGFCLVVRRELPIASILVFLLLVTTDVTLLLYSRFDFGPVSMALSLRLFWIALWISQELSRKLDGARTFLLGAIPSLLIYEKLSNVVFLVALLVAVLMDKQRRSRRQLTMLSAGFAVGAIPFGFVNWIGRGISFAQISAGSLPPSSFEKLPFWRMVKVVLGLGTGQEARNIFLGSLPEWAVKYPEALALILLLVGIGVLGVLRFKTSTHARVIVCCLACYCLLPVFTWALPRGTGIHHWIVGVPFHYAAIAVSIAWFGEARRLDHGSGGAVRLAKCGALALGTVIFAARVANVYDTGRRLARGEASTRFDRSFTTVTTFVARHWREANFVAADYGFGAQAYCFSGGSYILPEPFWHYSGINDIQALVGSMPTGPIYVLHKTEPNPIEKAVRDGIGRDLNTVLGKGMPPAEEELQNLRGVWVEVFRNPPVGSRRL